MQKLQGSSRCDQKTCSEGRTSNRRKRCFRSCTWQRRIAMPKRLPELITDLDNAFRVLQATRPTAVNLFWALERVMGKGKRAKTVQEQKEQCLTRRSRWRKRTSKPTGKSEHMASSCSKTAILCSLTVMPARLRQSL